MPHHFYTVFFRLPLFLRILLIAILFIILFGIMISLIEPETFQNPFEGIWWAIITVSTVGYGDLVPKTIFGKLTGIFLILVGVSFFTSYFANLATATVKKQNKFFEGKASYKGKGHMIIIGWNERSKEIIQKRLLKNANESIVLIDETLHSSPYSNHSVHFIRGRASTDQILIKAGIHKAEKIIITADQSKNELQADMNSIITLLAVKGLNPHITSIVEILTSEQVVNAKRAGADKIIQSNLITSSVIMNCLASEGSVEPILSFLELLKGSKLNIRSAGSFIGKNFEETSTSLLKEGSLLLGIKRGEETFLNPNQHFKIQDRDLLLIIAH